MTTFVKQPQTFFAISEVTNPKFLNRKKSTSNFLWNYNIIEKTEKTSSKNSNENDSEEEDEYVAEINQPLMNNPMKL